MLFTSALFVAYFGLIIVIIILFLSFSDLVQIAKKRLLHSSVFSLIAEYYSKIREKLIMFTFKASESYIRRWKKIDSLLLSKNMSLNKHFWADRWKVFIDPNKKHELTGNITIKYKQFNLLLLAASLIFYCTLNHSLTFLLLAVVTWDYLLSKAIFYFNAYRRVWITLSICLNISTLIYFKYAQFIAKNALILIYKVHKYNHYSDQNKTTLSNVSPKFHDLVQQGTPADSLGTFQFEFDSYFNSLEAFSQIDWVLPLGISFFIFQSISYTIDVYRGTLKPANSWTDYCLYVCFFPQLVAGPIVKAKDFLPQLYHRLDWSQVPLLTAFGWIGLGLFKKAVLADRLAEIVDFAYGNINALDWTFALVSMISYSMQIFLDFSGYSDIAIGIALLFGFRLSKNFDLPYFSRSFSEFWSRWHISLSSWLKDYLYISLGGNRVTALITYRNLFLVMLLGGFWHGASWNFIIWGGMHGIFLVVERWFKSFKKKDTMLVSNESASQAELAVSEKSSHRLRKIVALSFNNLFPTIIVFSLTTILWVFFRASDFSEAIALLERFFLFDSGITVPYSLMNQFLLVLVLFSVGHIAGKCKIHPEFWEKKSFSYSYAYLFAGLVILITLTARSGKPFIYFVF